jgi:hypothetical protein
MGRPAHLEVGGGGIRGRCVSWQCQVGASVDDTPAELALTTMEDGDAGVDMAEGPGQVEEEGLGCCR